MIGPVWPIGATPPIAKPVVGAHEVGVGAFERLADERAHLGLVDPIGAAGDDQQRPAGLAQAEDERLGDLVDAAADRAGGVGGRAGREPRSTTSWPRPSACRASCTRCTVALANSATLSLARRPRARRPNLGEVLDVVVGDVGGVLQQRDRAEEARDAGALAARRRERAQEHERLGPCSLEGLAASSSKLLHAVIALPRPRLGR